MRKNYYKFIFILPLFLLFIFPWQVVIVLTLIFSLFFFTHLKYNNLKLETYEITPAIKNPRTPMNWYRDVIINQMYVLRWNLVEDTPEKKVWKPRGQTRVMEDSFTMTYSPYLISISGSRNMIKMMKSFLDLEKIYL